MSEQRIALYFGPLRTAGHFLWAEEYARGLTPPADCPWDIGLMDTGLLCNRKVPDLPDGRVHWVCGGRPILWFGFFWWDRSVDSRGASNSGFYVRWGTPPADLDQEKAERIARAAFIFACGTWPGVVERQEHPLILVDLPSGSGSTPT